MLWSVASYFNPGEYRSRLKNYQAFRRHLGVPLVTVELSFDGRFELRPPDADILVQLEGGDVMWQKERLLNIALESLPAECDAVAWVDCDVLFGDREWARKAERALERVELLHLFDEFHDLPAGAGPQSPRNWNRPSSRRSLVRRLETGQATAVDIATRTEVAAQSAVGLAWAMRREVLDRHGLYDGCILGGGDLAILGAATGEFRAVARRLMMGPDAAEHYFRWARPFDDAVRGRMGHLDGRAFHLWHGARSSRRSTERYDILRECNFDPLRDISLDRESRCWRWSSDKPELHTRVREYFVRRDEDAEVTDEYGPLRRL